MTIRIIFADNHPIIRSGIRMIFQNESDFEIVGEAIDGKEALALCEEKVPDLALLDVSMPEMNGIEATIAIKEKFPQIKIAIFSSHNNPAYVTHAMEAGASAYLLKDEDMDKLPPILKSVADGKEYVSSETEEGVDAYRKTTEEQASLSGMLTGREKEILQLIVDGQTTKEVAFELNISARTAETHKYNIMQKLETHDIASLVRFAIKNNLVSGV